MKLKKNRIIVSALALAISASLVGSVGGTIAWYQYSTRANASFIGKSSGFSGNLQMRFKGDDDNSWRTRITWREMDNKLRKDGYAQQVMPMTFEDLEKRDDALDASKGYVQPELWQGDMSKWTKAEKRHYAQFELQLRYNERDGEISGQETADAKNIQKKVYLSKLLIQEDVANNNNNKEDLSDAVRVHISASYGNGIKNKLISKNGGEIYTNGKLDLDNDGKPDQAYTQNDTDAGEFGFGGDNELKDIVYGKGKQASYSAKSELEDGEKWSQDEINLANAYNKTTSDWKVEPVEDDPATPADETVVGVHWTQQEIDLANARGKTTSDWRVQPDKFDDQDALDEYNQANNTNFVLGDDIPGTGEKWTQNQIDLANAYDKTIHDYKVAPEYFTRDEVELANDAHGKTIDDWKKEPIYPALAGITNNKLSNLDFDHDGDGEGEGHTPNIDKYIGETIESETEFLTVKVTIWVEGWQELDGSAIWDEVKYIDSSFDVGIQFAVEDAEF